MRSVVLKSGMVTFAAMVASVAVAAVAMGLQGQVLEGNALLLSFLCPLFVAWPVSAYNYWQKRNLTHLHDQLAQAHDDLAAAHRSLADAHARLAMRASRDAMTGLLNRESFFQAVEGAHRDGEACHLLIIDADHFKAINDTHGHTVGDAALVAIATAISRAAGAHLVAGRIGGEEFAVCIPAGHARSDVAVAEAIRAEVAGLRFLAADATPIALSVSIGGATFAPRLAVSSVFQLADKRLYAAKSRGRNSIVTGASVASSVAA
ncbi:GGDEF domain-containing protein [Aquibium carbonis]|uniref:diguanylate cyclase n=1 Tax=Aquibium carbonis TaxID=2495581 RepID=A0A429Z150_9HYPH|nr:GGDEF domain-containing protein [Aquibium carbonis]RST87452.1 GGDEF domain-containing protein [Aquibium carbonis]